MALTARPSSKTERAERSGQTPPPNRSDIVRQAIERYTAAHDSEAGERSVYDDWADVIGIGHLGARSAQDDA